MEPFLEAYAIATGTKLTLIEGGENPDFVCLRPDDSLVGVELTEVTRSPMDKHLDSVLSGRDELEPFDAQAIIFSLLARKEEARSKRYVLRVANNILVFLLTDASLSNIMPALDVPEDDFNDQGFDELWIADYSSMDAHGTTDLYALYPARLRGFYRRHNFDTKPYG